MTVRVKRSPAFVPGSSGTRVKGTAGRLTIFMRPSPSGGGAGTGTALDPYVLSTDGTPLLFSIDSSVAAEYRQDVEGNTPFYGKYATFVCPTMSPGDTLRIRFGVPVDPPGDAPSPLDTYMYLFEGSTFALGVSTYVTEDDDAGSGDYDTFENTLLEFPEGTLTAGQSYILELTTFDTTVTGDLKVIADVVVPVASGVTLDDGVVVTNVTAGGTYPYNAGDVVTMDTTDADKSFTISYGMSFTFGSMPYDLSTGTYSSSGLYTVTTSTATFDLDVTVTPPDGLVFTGDSGPQVITGGESVSFSAFFGPTPTLTTTLVDTSWTLKDPFDVIITTGTLPITNLRTVWIDNGLSTGTAYTMVASGITFTITRTGG